MEMTVSLSLFARTLSFALSIAELSYLHRLLHSFFKLLKICFFFLLSPAPVPLIPNILGTKNNIMTKGKILAEISSHLNSTRILLATKD